MKIPYPNRERLGHEFSLVGRFFSVGVVGQICSAIVGILIIRGLDKESYAYYVLFFTLTATLLQFTDLGVVSGAMRAAGKRFESREGFSSVIRTARKFRWVLLGMGCVPIGVWGYWLLAFENDAPFPLALGLIALVLILGFFSLEKALFQLVPRIANNHEFLFRAGLFLPLVRLGIGLALFVTVLNLYTALLLFVLMVFLEYGLYRKAAIERVDLAGSGDPVVLSEIRAVVRRQSVNVLFFAFFSQISIWLISVFGTTENVAEVGALGRLSMLFAFLFPLLDNIVYPRISRAKNFRALEKQAYYGFFLVFLIGSGLCTAVLLFGEWILMVLGDAYSHLQWELFLVALSVLFHSGSNHFQQVNAARGWIVPPTIQIPTRLVSLVVFLMLVDVSTVRGVIELQLYTNALGMVYFFVFLQYNLRAHKEQST